VEVDEEDEVEVEECEGELLELPDDELDCDADIVLLSELLAVEELVEER
jgi:hypothetical protein